MVVVPLCTSQFQGCGVRSGWALSSTSDADAATAHGMAVAPGARRWRDTSASAVNSR